MNLLTGEYNNTIDDKGRVSFPVKLRTAVNQNVVMVTKGLDRCLWLFTTEEWDAFQPVEFDKNGRLSIPQSLREYANLSKDCVVLGIAKYMELWDSKTYTDYLAESEADFRNAAEEFNDINF